MNKEEFEEEAPTIYAFYSNAIKNNRFPHAVLIYGDNGANVEDVAKYIAKSLLCDTGNFACEKCDNCKGFEKKQLVNFLVVDGRTGNIKKETIADIEEHFSMSFGGTNENSAYCIFEVSNMTVEAANALLKFLEEPPSGVHAILTTTRREKVLPTILSRVVSLKLVGKEKYSVDLEKVDYLIERLHLNIASTDDEFDLFEDALEVANQFFNDYLYSGLGKTLNVLIEKGGALKGSLCYNYLYSILYQVFMDILEQNTNTPYRDVVIGLKKKSLTIFEAAKFLEEVISSARVNFNSNLVLGRLAYILEGRK